MNTTFDFGNTKKSNDPNKVVQVEATGFHLSDGRFFQHPEWLEDIPDVETFNALFEKSRRAVEYVLGEESHV